MPLQPMRKDVGPTLGVGSQCDGDGLLARQFLDDRDRAADALADRCDVEMRGGQRDV
ncbi:Uncharacterised protein [Mycobacterium tuberculosis]|nr:Uncharacterised protein [Mycobacterium tuberculosis]